MKIASSLLLLDDITVAFSGFKAINGLSMAIDHGELRAVIGPNGAGKTTMMDIITGKTRPDSGVALWDGEIDLTKSDEASTARLGIGRKFQKPTVFETLSLRENMALALAGRRGVFERLFARPTAAEKTRIDELLTLARLSGRTHDLAGSLSHGQKQWLEIAMLLAQGPRLLLIDEPAAGMTDAETMMTAELLKSLAGARSILVVEHDMHFVRALGCKTTVLHEGRVLAEGGLDQVCADPRVIDVYLGR